jgi:hypothetical protein
MSVRFVVDKRHGASAADSLVSVSSTSAPSSSAYCPAGIQWPHNGPYLPTDDGRKTTKHQPFCDYITVRSMFQVLFFSSYASVPMLQILRFSSYDPYHKLRVLFFSSYGPVHMFQYLCFSSYALAPMLQVLRFSSYAPVRMLHVLLFRSYCSVNMLQFLSFRSHASVLILRFIFQFLWLSRHLWQFSVQSTDNIVAGFSSCL